MLMQGVFENDQILIQQRPRHQLDVKWITCVVQINIQA
jgi:hypothetical protein